MRRRQCVPAYLLELFTLASSCRGGRLSRGPRSCSGCRSLRFLSLQGRLCGATCSCCHQTEYGRLDCVWNSLPSDLRPLSLSLGTCLAPFTYCSRLSPLARSFIHSGYLYSAPSRNLLRGALSPATVKEKCLKKLAERKHVVKPGSGAPRNEGGSRPSARGDV